MDSPAIFALGHDLPLIYKMFHGFQELDVPSEKGDFFIFDPHLRLFPKHRSLLWLPLYLCYVFKHDCNKLTFEVNLPSEQ